MTVEIEIKDPRVRHAHFTDDGEMLVMLPLVGGETYSADNTCQAAVAMQGFFEKSTDEDVNKHSARRALNAYQKTIPAQIKILEMGFPTSATQTLVQKRKSRQTEITRYLDVIALLSRHADFQGLSENNPIYPDTITGILGQKTNLLSISLSPDSPDYARRFADAYVCHFGENRDSYQGKTAEKLRAKLKVRPDLVKAFVRSIEHKKPSDMPNVIDSADAFGKVIQFLQNVLQTEYGATYQLQTATCNFAAFKDVVLFDNATFSDCAEQILNVSIEDKNIFKKGLHDISPFDMPLGEGLGSTYIDNFSIKTQFLIALVNVYCKAFWLIESDFGQILESNEALQDTLANAVKRAHDNNHNIDDVILDFIQNHAANFGLMGHTLTPNIRANIKTWFSATFKGVNDTRHFDEFLFLIPEKEGAGFSCQGALCIDLAGFVVQHEAYLIEAHRNALEAIAFKAMELNQTTRSLVPKTEYVLGTVEIDDETLAQKLKGLATAGGEGLYDLAYLLCSDVVGDTSQKVFEVISSAFRVELQQKLAGDNWTRVKAHIAALESTRVVNRFDTAFKLETKTMHLPMEMAHAFNAALVMEYGPKYAFNPHSAKDMHALLNIILFELNVSVVAVADANEGGYSVTYADDSIPTKLKELNDFYKGRMYLSGGAGQFESLTTSIYRAVRARLQESSEIYQTWNRRINGGASPQYKHGYYTNESKIGAAFAHLDLPIKDISNSVMTGYILEAEPVVLREVENIHAHHGLLDITEERFQRFKNIALVAGKIDETYFSTSLSTESIATLLNHLGFASSDFKCFIEDNHYLIEARYEVRERLKNLRSKPTQMTLFGSLSPQQQEAIKTLEKEFQKEEQGGVDALRSELKSQCRLFTSLPAKKEWRAINEKDRREALQREAAAEAAQQAAAQQPATESPAAQLVSHSAPPRLIQDESEAPILTRDEPSTSTFSSVSSTNPLRQELLGNLPSVMEMLERQELERAIANSLTDQNFASLTEEQQIALAIAESLQETSGNTSFSASSASSSSSQASTSSASGSAPQRSTVTTTAPVRVSTVQWLGPVSEGSLVYAVMFAGVRLEIDFAAQAELIFITKEKHTTRNGYGYPDPDDESIALRTKQLQPLLDFYKITPGGINYLYLNGEYDDVEFGSEFRQKFIRKQRQTDRKFVYFNVDVFKQVQMIQIHNQFAEVKHNQEMVALDSETGKSALLFMDEIKQRVSEYLIEFAEKNPAVIEDCLRRRAVAPSGSVMSEVQQPQSLQQEESTRWDGFLAKFRGMNFEGQLEFFKGASPDEDKLEVLKRLETPEKLKIFRHIGTTKERVLLYNAAATEGDKQVLLGVLPEEIRDRFLAERSKGKQTIRGGSASSASTTSQWDAYRSSGSSSSQPPSRDTGPQNTSDSGSPSRTFGGPSFSPSGGSN